MTRGDAIAVKADWVRASVSCWRHRPASGVTLLVRSEGADRYFLVALSAGGLRCSAPYEGALESAFKYAERLGQSLSSLIAGSESPALAEQPAAPAAALEIPSYSELVRADASARGGALRQLRRRCNLTKHRLSALACVSPACIRRLENGVVGTRPASLRIVLATLSTYSRSLATAGAATGASKGR